MARSKSSHRWLKEHFSDPYVKKAQQQGMRSRAAYKLLEIQQKHPFLKRGMTIIDLGAAPGGWTQVVASLIGGEPTTIIALDILPMDNFADVTFIQGDFGESSVHQQLLDTLAGKSVDVVLSDIAPNMSGNRSADQLRFMQLIETAYHFAKQVLTKKGILLFKMFYGEGFDAFLKQVRSEFQEVKIYKPDASRSRSPECYLWAAKKKIIEC